MKYYKYIPIVKSDAMPEIKNVGANLEASIRRHEKRQLDALTEFICEIAKDHDSKSIRSLYMKYDLKLIESNVDGSRVISSSFPDKRFY